MNNDAVEIVDGFGIYKKALSYETPSDFSRQLIFYYLLENTKCR